MIELTKPIIWFDTETTGVNVATDRIIEIGCVKINPDGSRDPRLMRLNPGVPIPATASDVHGIFDKDVETASTFARVGRGMYNFFKGCDIGGFNSNDFDVVLLAEEFSRIGIFFPDPGTRFVDANVIFKKMEARTLTAAVRFYLDEDHEGAHSAREDTEATIRVFEAQLQKYDDLKKMTFDELCVFSSYDDPELTKIDIGGKICRDKNGQYIYNFGKHKGKLISENMTYATKFMLDPANNFPKTVTTALHQVIAEIKGTTGKLF